eukprot:Filipodium_phascolosomae@DN2390_c0_g1_i1.p1
MIPRTPGRPWKTHRFWDKHLVTPKGWKFQAMEFFAKHHRVLWVGKVDESVPHITYQPIFDDNAIITDICSESRLEGKKSHTSSAKLATYTMRCRFLLETLH